MSKTLTYIQKSLILSLLFFLLIPQSSAQAANIIVDTANDVIDANSGNCSGLQISHLPGPDLVTSLREAICAADGTAGPDTITFASDYTITLGGTQLPPIMTEITINGTGIGNTIIQASTCNPITVPGGCTPATHQVLAVNGTGILVMTDLTIRYGDTGITNSGTLSIERCAVSENSPSSGITNSGNIRSISDSAISGNRARRYHGYNGGGISSWGIIGSISNTIFDQNSAYNYGGGISTHSVGTGGSIDTISNCTFSNNHAGFGGGIFNRFNIGVIDNSTFIDNDANHHGGGIANYGNIDNITNTTLHGNDSRLGGGLMNNQLISTISQNTFDDNHADEGGAIYNNTSDRILTIVNTTFSGNSARDYGGAINNNGTITTLANSTLYRNWSDDNVGNGILNLSTIDTISNTLTAYSFNDHCQGSPPTSSINNITDANDCWNWPNSLNYILHLGPLADNGGPTETHALMLTSPNNPAINTGDPTTCSSPPVNNLDQRGVTRSNYGICDIGAFEYSGDNVELIVTTSNPTDGTVTQNVSQITVSFNKDVVHDGGANAANNPANYLLVEAGSNEIFDTQSCQNGHMSDDSLVPISSVSYDSGSYTATLIPNPSPLPEGEYRLFVCGTTSIFDLLGLELNYGLRDTLVDITIQSGATSLPNTGFAPGVITNIPEQPTQRSYALYSDIWLEIPKIGVVMDVVGVPLVNGIWDVTWLGGNAGYLAGTAFPTWAGNTVLTGHVWDAWNQPGPFARLKSLQFGDRFYIHAYGQIYTYEIRSNYRVSPENLSVLSHSDYDMVTLLTCEHWKLWTGEYQFRRAVKAILVNIQME